MTPGSETGSPPTSSGPEISVIIPAYQSAWSIERTLRSVFAQRFGNFEVIVVDDGSTDDLHERLQRFVNQDDRVRVLRQPNRGLAATRNRAFLEARAPLVGPIDADDVWHPDFLMDCKKALDEDENAPFAFARSFRMDEHDLVSSMPKTYRSFSYDLAGLLSYNSVGNGSAALFRRKAVLVVGGYDETMRSRGLEGAEDWKLILRLARRAPPILVDRYLVGYRRVQSGMSQSDPDRQLRAVLEVIREFREEAPELPSSLFRDARTTMIAWLLPIFVRRGEYRRSLKLLAKGYIANPFWFLNPMVRHFHYGYISALFYAIKQLSNSSPKTFHLADVWFNEERPFYYFK